MSTTNQPEPTYHIGSGTPYPNTQAGFAACVVDDLLDNPCFAGYCAADPKHKAEAIQRVQSCPVAASMIAPFQGKATAQILMNNKEGVKGYKLIARWMLGIRETSRDPMVQTVLTVTKIGAAVASVLIPNRSASCIRSSILEVSTLQEAIDKKESRVFLLGIMYVVIVYEKTKMIPFFRTSEESFETTTETTTERVVREQDLIVATNGNWYEFIETPVDVVLPDSTALQVTSSISPTKPSEVIQQGQSILDGQIIGGRASNGSYYITELEGTYSTGFGEPPLKGQGVGGAMPVIINGLPYNGQNTYSEGVSLNAVLIGEPLQEDKKYLLQRSSAKYAGMESENIKKGKNIWAYSSYHNCSLIIIVPDGKGELTYDILRDDLLNNKFNHAVAFDGSDSVFLNVNGEFLVRAGRRKNNANTMGIGIKCR